MKNTHDKRLATRQAEPLSTPRATVQRRALASSRARAARAWFGAGAVQRSSSEEERRRMRRSRLRRASVGEALEAGLVLGGETDTLAGPGRLAGGAFSNSGGAVTVDDLIEQDFRDHLAGRGEASITELIEEDFRRHLAAGE